MGSQTKFDAGNFSRTVGVSLFGGIAAAAFAARQCMQAEADEAATADALASWQILVANLEAEIATLQNANASLELIVARLEDQLLIAHAELATSQHRLAQRGAGPSI